MTLNDVKRVDLKRSDINWEASDPLKGKYVFRKKVYITDSSYVDDNLRPAHVLKFVANDEDNESMDNVQTWMYDFQAEPVTMEDRDYWPEPLKPNSNHQYKFKDMLFMKIPIGIWVDKMEKDQKRANEEVSFDKEGNPVGTLQRKFESDAVAAGRNIPEMSDADAEKVRF